MKTLDSARYTALELPEHGPPEVRSSVADTVDSNMESPSAPRWERTSDEIDQLLAAAERALDAATNVPEPVVNVQWPALSTAAAISSAADGDSPELSNELAATKLLRVEVAQSTLSADQVEQLRSGQPVRLAAPSPTEVVVYLGEQRVARGQLVVCDNHYSVRITEVNCEARAS